MAVLFIEVGIEELLGICRIQSEYEIYVVWILHKTLILLLLLQSALQPLWVLACLPIVEYSQQEGFYRVPLPAACQNSNLEDQ